MSEDPPWLRGLGPAFLAAVDATEQQGRMTFRELDTVLPPGDYTAARIEDVLAYLRRKGIEIVEDDEG